MTKVKNKHIVICEEISKIRQKYNFFITSDDVFYMILLCRYIIRMQKQKKVTSFLKNGLEQKIFIFAFGLIQKSLSFTFGLIQKYYGKNCNITTQSVISIPYIFVAVLMRQIVFYLRCFFMLFANSIRCFFSPVSTPIRQIL